MRKTWGSKLHKGKKVIDAVDAAGIFYMEGLMYRCHPQIPKLIELIKVKQLEILYQ